MNAILNVTSNGTTGDFCGIERLLRLKLHQCGDIFLTTNQMCSVRAMSCTS